MRWPLDHKLNRSVDKIGGPAIVTAINTRRDDAMNWLRFPGCVSFATLGTTDAVYWWDGPSYGVAVCEGKLYRLLESGQTEITGAVLEGGLPVSFADFGTTIVMANGGRMVKWNAADSACSYVGDVDAPQNVVSVAYFGQYLVALDADGINWFSEVNDPDTWLGEFFQAENQRDKSIAQAVDSDNLVIFGRKTVERFYLTGDPTGPIAPVTGATLNIGIESPYSVTQDKVSLAYFFLAEGRKVVRLQGEVPQIISEAIAPELQKLSRVDDARGFHLNCNGETSYCLVFPSDGIGWAYDYKRDDWCQFGAWDTETASFVAPLFSCGAYFRGWNKYVAGGEKLYYVGTEYTNDDGNLNRLVIETGLLNGGTAKGKTCQELIFTLLRGRGGNTEPFLMLQYRDDGKGIWSRERWISLGASQLSQTTIHKALRSLGQYKARQWRIVITDNVPVCILPPEETVQVLR